MNTDKELLFTLRSSGLIKGRMPFITIISHKSTYIKFKKKQYVLSYRDDNIYIESLSSFSKLPNHKQDIEFNVSDIKSYSLTNVSKSIQALYLYIGHRSICMYMSIGYLKSAYSEDNFLEFIKYLKDKGVKRV